MKTLNEIPILEFKELVLKNWMTHDGAWFLHCFRELGIEKTNRLNKAAIKSLSDIELKRVMKIWGLEKEPIDSFEKMKDLANGMFALGVGDFMGGTFSFPEQNVIRWQVENQGCFAYRGLKRMGVIDRYECGVLYRVFCWLENLGVRYTVSQPLDGCLFHTCGKCEIDIVLSLS